MKPPFEITPVAAGLVASIERELGRYEGALVTPASPMLRRSMRIRTIHASLAIEGNTLSEEQVTALLDGKRIIAPLQDIQEVQNAIICYELLNKWKPTSTKHFLAAHKQMMKGLVPRPGAWRSGGVGIAKGNVITHVAPPADRVPGLVGTLFDWLKSDKVTPRIIQAAVCHYELEFIHPFTDGNGRMGRLWHSLILYHHHAIFNQVPVESVIRDRQADYYNVLGECDKVGKSTAFVEFALEITLEALSTIVSSPQSRMSASQRITMAKDHFGKQWFTRKDYRDLFPALSTASASRDLQQAASEDLVVREGDKAKAMYQYIMKPKGTQ